MALALALALFSGFGFLALANKAPEITNPPEIKSKFEAARARPGRRTTTPWGTPLPRVGAEGGVPVPVLAVGVEAVGVGVEDVDKDVVAARPHDAVDQQPTQLAEVTAVQLE